MHTRSQLRSADFQWIGSAAGLDALIPEWEPGTRVVFVAPDPAQDLADLAGLILALAHAFYDRAEAREPGFYDYPSHFVVGGSAEAEPRLLHTAACQAWSEAWCEMDVWPNTHHAVADPSPGNLIQAVYMLEPNVLVWPAHLALPSHYAPAPNAVSPDQSDMEGLLRRRLHRVLHYTSGPATEAAAATQVALSGASADLARKAIGCLPADDVAPAARLSSAAYWSVRVEDFLRPEGRRASPNRRDLPT